MKYITVFNIVAKSLSFLPFSSSFENRKIIYTYRYAIVLALFLPGSLVSLLFTSEWG